MRLVLAYAAGFVSGWAARSAFGSVRGLAVGGVSLGVQVTERARRLVATEREFLEDLVAEARTAAGVGRQRTRAPARPTVVA